MSATLASYGSALALKHAERLSFDVVVLAVVLSLSLSRTERERSRHERLLVVVLLPVVAAIASEVGALLASEPTLGDTLFVLAMSGSIWVRRFGRRFAKAGTLVMLSFLAPLITPAIPGAGHAHVLWAAVVGAIAYVWVGVVQTAGQRSGFVERAPAPPSVAMPTRSSQRRLAASTRMAAQMAVALTVALALGRALFGVHWSWLVMTAFIVLSGNRGRADVLYKGVLRLLGATAGTIAATVIAGAFAPGDAVSVVLIFVVLGVASWLRSFSYAFWAAGVTAVLALLYGYFGQTGTSLLTQRLEGIVVGALVAVAASWLVLPVRTVDVLRRRMADALAALGGVLTAVTTTHGELAARALHFE
jgi:hypothetical protein